MFSCAVQLINPVLCLITASGDNAAVCEPELDQAFTTGCTSLLEVEGSALTKEGVDAKVASVCVCRHG